MIEYNIKCSASNVFIDHPEVTFLGHTCSKDGMRKSRKFVESILKIDKPKFMSDLLDFLSSIQWLSRYVKSYAEIIEPLTRARKTDRAALRKALFGTTKCRRRLKKSN